MKFKDIIRNSILGALLCFATPLYQMLKENVWAALLAATVLGAAYGLGTWWYWRRRCLAVTDKTDLKQLARFFACSLDHQFMSIDKQREAYLEWKGKRKASAPPTPDRREEPRPLLILSPIHDGQPKEWCIDYTFDLPTEGDMGYAAEFRDWEFRGIAAGD